MLPPAARAYVALTAVLAVGAVALLVAVDDGPGETFSFELPVEPLGASGALVRSVLAGHTVSERGHRRV